MSSGSGKRLNILMVAPQPFFRARGTPFSVLHRIRAVIQAGHSVDLLTYPFGENIEMGRLKIIRCTRPLWIHDIRIGPSSAKLVLDLSLYFLARRQLKQSRYDVLHTHEEAAFFMVGLARKYKLRHLYDMHSSLPQQLENFSAYDIALFRSVFEYLEKRTLRSADGLITICQDLADVAEAIVPDTTHSMIENTGDDSAIFAVKKSDLRGMPELEGKSIVLYTGTFEPYQGLDLLLEAFAQVQQSQQLAHLLMVGGSDKQVAQYRDKAASLGLTGSVTFTGTVPPGKIPAIVNVADIIVSPRSRGTNTPLKIYAAMRSGKPLVATNSLTHTQVLSAETAKLVPARADTFAQGIIQLLEKPELGRRLATNARALADANYSDASYLAKVAEIYSRVSDQVLPRST
jgi:glycosyltransferase involved in cell wall biosynthesis